MIDHDNRIIYIHIGKTGGSSVTQFYGLCSLKECRDLGCVGCEGKLNDIIYPKYNAPYSDGVHDDILKAAQAVERVHGTTLEDYHKFSVIRKPSHYVRSCWNEWHTKRFPSFGDFVSQGWFKAVINPQVRHHLMIDNHIEMDRLFTFEELPDVFEHIRDLLDYHDIDDIHANKKIHNHDNNEIGDWIEGIINEFFWEDYNIYETLSRNK